MTAGRLKMYAEFWGNSVWALTAVVAAFLIFFYGAMDHENYGISARMVL